MVLLGPSTEGFVRQVTGSPWEHGPSQVILGCGAAGV